MDNLQEIFKAYDVRGRVDTELTADVVTNIGRAFADWLPDDGVVAVGRDMRPDSAELAAAMIAGLRGQGRNVLDIGEVTSDMIYFAVGHFKLAGGAMITASHNPGIYNGIKFCATEARAIGQDSGLFEIRDAIVANIYKSAGEQTGEPSEQDVAEDWIQHTLGFIDPAKLTPLKLAVDAGNGMAGKIFPELEPYVPWEITEMYFELDGTFPNHEANPLKFETLADMIAVIQRDKLDGGIAFDGDGDRAFLVDETGTVLTGGVVTAMLAEYFLSKHPGSNILYNVCTSRTVRDVVEAAGGMAVMTKVGHSNIKQVMREVDAPFGGEASGHFYFRDNWYADSGLIAAVIGLYVATLSGKSLSQIREQYTHYAAITETNYIVTDKTAAMQAAENLFPEAEVNKLDGVTLTLPSGAWLNVRPSNTEPLLRLNAEAKDQQELDEIVDKVSAIFVA
jgi:phosphomannomutase